MCVRSVFNFTAGYILDRLFFGQTPYYSRVTIQNGKFCWISTSLPADVVARRQIGMRTVQDV